MADYKDWNKAYERYNLVVTKGWEQAYKQKPLHDWQAVGGWTYNSWNEFCEETLKGK